MKVARYEVPGRAIVGWVRPAGTIDERLHPLGSKCDHFDRPYGTCLPFLTPTQHSVLGYFHCAPLGRPLATTLRMGHIG